jgi:hypothetical protein
MEEQKMSENDFDAYVKSLDEAHNPADVPDFSEVPAGSYQVRLDKIYINRSKTSGRTQCVMEFDVISGRHTGRTIWKFGGMMSAEQLDYLTNDLKRIGIKDFKWSNLQEKFPSVLDKTFEIQIKQKGEFKNIYIIRELTTKDFVSDEVKNGDDVPF